MKHSTVAEPKITIGLDLGDKYSYLHALSKDGEIVEEGRVRTTLEARRALFGEGFETRVIGVEFDDAIGNVNQLSVIDDRLAGRSVIEVTKGWGGRKSRPGRRRSCPPLGRSPATRSGATRSCTPSRRRPPGGAG